ncbi:hypothetical protein E2320_013484 [Naja naja]|nr:hypothetical protein E2320_013484 [Naja naja]
MAEQREILAVTASSLLPTHPRLPQPCAVHSSCPRPGRTVSFPHPSLNCLDDPEYAASRLALSPGTRGCIGGREERRAAALLRTPRLNRASPEPGHGRHITLKKGIQVV